MAGSQIIDAAVNEERLIGWGFKADDGATDLSGRRVNSVEDTVTLAQLNAGKVVLPGAPGRKYKVLGFYLKFTGNFAGATDIRLSGTDSTPTDIVTVAIAQATDGTTHSHISGTNTVGAGFMADLAAGSGVQLRKTGDTATGGTSVTVQITYRIVA